MRADWPSDLDKPKWQRADRKKMRYSICKMCREKWNIAINQDTSAGYFCPRCEEKRKNRKKKYEHT